MLMRPGSICKLAHDFGAVRTNIAAILQGGSNEADIVTLGTPRRVQNSRRRKAKSTTETLRHLSIRSAGPPNISNHHFIYDRTIPCADATCQLVTAQDCRC